MKKTLSAVILAIFAVCAAAGLADGKTKDIKPMAGYKKAAMERFYVGVLKEAGLKPNDLEVYSIGQSHIDAAWRWRVHQTRDKCIKTFSNAVMHMEKYPDYRFTQSSPQFYEWVMEDDPGLFEQIKKYEKEGRWEIVGGQWVEPDNVMPDGESFVRQRLLGMRFYQEHFGHTTEIAWLLDSFGYQKNLPQILAKSGAKYFWTSKLTWNDTTVFPFHFFHWQSPDGSRVLTYFTPLSHYPLNFPTSEINKYYDTRYLLPDDAPELVADYSSDYGQLKKQLSGEWLNIVGVFYGKGDGGHGPTTSEVQAQKMLQKKGYTKIAPATELYASLDKYAKNAPVWNDELYLEYHRGTLTTQGPTKRNNRHSEQLMRTAEVLQSLGSRFDLKYAYSALKRAWKLVLLNQFHDILPGSSIPEVFADADKDYEKIKYEAHKAIEDGKAALADNISTKGGSGTPIVVFNTLSWERGGTAELKISKTNGAQAVADANGNKIPSQTGTCMDLKGECLLFSADGIPSLGHKVYYLVDSKAMGEGPAVKETPGDITIDNGITSVMIDRKTGWLKSVIDIETGKEFLAGNGNQLMAFRDRASNYPAWNINKNYLKKEKKMPAASAVTVTAKGPLFVEVTAKRRFGKSDISQIIRVYKNDPRVHMATDFDFHDADTLVKAGFDTTIKAETIAAETSYAAIERPTHPKTPAQKAMWEASCHRWLDLSDGEFGLALLNNGKYGYSLNEDGTGFRLTLLKAALYPESAVEAYDVQYEKLPYNIRTLMTLNRQTDQGRHTAWTAILPHQGDWKQARIWQAGYEFNTPIEVTVTNSHDGPVASSASFISVDNPDVYIGAVKKAEDDDDLVIRLIEATGNSGNVNVDFNNMGKIKGAVETDLLEWNPTNVKYNKDSVSVEMKPFEIKTVKVSISR
jgi:alpha-mannosidase